MVLQHDGTPAKATTARTIVIAITSGSDALQKLTSAGRAKRLKPALKPVAQPATFWLETRCGQRVSMDQIGSIFGRE